MGILLISGEVVSIKDETMSILIINEETYRQVAQVVAYASAREHWYLPYAKPRHGLPGDMPEHCIQLGSYRCVFSYTEVEGSVCRHLSISVATEGKLPSPIAVCEIAVLFGFTGSEGPGKPGKDWTWGPHPTEPCIVVVQTVLQLQPSAQGGEP